MIDIDVRADVSDVLRKMPQAHRLVRQAAGESINAAGSATRKYTIDELRRRSGIPKRRLGSRVVTVYRASRRNLSTAITGRFHAMPAATVGPFQQGKQGTRVRGIGLIPGAFVAPSRVRAPGQQVVYRRKGRKRMPIDEVKIELKFGHRVLEQAGDVVASATFRADFPPRLTRKLNTAGLT